MEIVYRKYVAMMRVDGERKSATRAGDFRRRREGPAAHPSTIDLFAKQRESVYTARSCVYVYFLCQRLHSMFTSCNLYVMHERAR